MPELFSCQSESARKENSRWHKVEGGVFSGLTLIRGQCKILDLDGT